MFLRNQKGETIVEVVVSMTIFVTIIMYTSLIIANSINTSKSSLDIINRVNGDVIAIEQGDLDLSDAATSPVSIDLSYGISDDRGVMMQSNERYLISDNLRALVTANGLLYFYLP